MEGWNHTLVSGEGSAQDRGNNENRGLDIDTNLLFPVAEIQWVGLELSRTGEFQRIWPEQ